jgi:predicted alpha/beta-fold hydrolase
LAGEALNSFDDARQTADSFLPPRLLRSAHLQTMAGSVPPRSWLIERRAALLLSRARPMLLDCGDGVRLQAFHSPQVPSRRASDARRLAILLHGWEGNVESPYVLSAAALLYGHGFAVVRMHLRDHGGTQALNRELFHSCRLPEVIGAVRALSAQFPGALLHLGGFSLGGNFMLRVAADAAAPDSIAGVVAVSPVLNPEATLTALERGLTIYRQYFVRRWTQSLRLKQRAWPAERDYDPLIRSQDLRRMTADLVRHCTDFGSLEAYLDGYAVTGSRLASLRFPAHVLLAADDPIIPAADLAALSHGSHLRIVRTHHGGHCGFIDSWRGPSFADRYMLEQFEQFERARGEAASR